MKKALFLIAILATFSFTVQAQWSGTNPLTTSSNVGIGTSSPAELLDVNGKIKSNGEIYITKNGGDSPGAGPYFQLGSATGTTYLQGLQLSAAGHLDLWSYDGSSFRQNMRIQNNGNVGIGTTNPSEKLEVNNSSGAKIAVSNTVGGYAKLGISDNSNSVASLSFTNTLSITGGGVAIGTIDPKGYQLAVDGDMIATSVKVKLYADWPDYVFKPKYQLPSLLSVKTYIDKNQHLPDIPSEQEIAKDGLNLGEMNKLLMKKVEELTLYLINQNMKVENQQKQINELKKQVNKK